MRILQLIEDGANASVAGNMTWRRNLYEPLVDAGHDVVLVPTVDGRVAMQSGKVADMGRFSERVSAVFSREHARRPFDLAFCYLMDGMIEPAVIDGIRLAGVPTANFSCNNMHQFGLVDGLSPHFDLNLHSERDVGDKFRAIGAAAMWWPMASNPRYFHPVDAAEDIDVSFVGAAYGRRAYYVAGLLDAGIDVHAYGPGWIIPGPWRRFKRQAKLYATCARAALALNGESRCGAGAQADDIELHLRATALHPSNFHDPVDDDELVGLYSRSRISLGVLEVYDRHDPRFGVVKHVHLREFEAPMSGACYCTQFSDELAESFEPGVEMIMWDGMGDLVEKVRYYLAHPGDARRIRNAGRKRALMCHTYQQRFSTLFAELGLA
jgi:hypothetical protein